MNSNRGKQRSAHSLRKKEGKTKKPGYGKVIVIDPLPNLDPYEIMLSALVIEVQHLDPDLEDEIVIRGVEIDRSPTASSIMAKLNYIFPHLDLSDSKKGKSNRDQVQFIFTMLKDPSSLQETELSKQLSKVWDDLRPGDDVTLESVEEQLIITKKSGPELVFEEKKPSK